MSGADLGIPRDEFVARFPRLWHMAEAGSWNSIVEHGLLSTRALLDLIGVNGPEREAVEAQRRPDSVVFEDAARGRVVIRDQKPIIESVLARTVSGCSVSDFYRLLNSFVFFWVSEGRLERLRNAPPYRSRPHLILTVDTAELVARHGDRVRLSHLNSGATHPAADYPRGPDTFQPFERYPWAARRSVNRREPVVELAVEYSVPDISDYVIARETR